MPNVMPLPFERPVTELEETLAGLEAALDPPRQAIRSLKAEILQRRREIFDKLDAWETVKVARHPGRPQTLDYIELLCDEFVELHGDRSFGDDRAIVTGFAKIDEFRVMFIGQHKGRNLQERNACYYGCAHPEGYRKALEKMRIAAKFGMPIVCLIDTPGAYPGIGAEERGQAYAIALNLREMSQISTPIVCTVIGEGGSGGALGIGIGDHVAVLQYAYYSVISPEGCAGILWKHGKHADQAARALRFTSGDLLKFGIVDEIVPEPLGGAHRDHRATAASLKLSVTRALRRLIPLTADALLEARYEKFRRIGVFQDSAASLHDAQVVSTIPAKQQEPDAAPTTSSDEASLTKSDSEGANGSPAPKANTPQRPSSSRVRSSA